MMRIVVLASGRGSNAANIFALAQQYPHLIHVEALICNKPQAGVLAHADSFGVPSFVIPVPKGTDSTERRRKHEERIHECLATLSFSYICLAGYMRVFTPEFVAQYPHSVWPVSTIINIHPSLLPSFPGTHGYDDAFSYGVQISGVTTHFVDAGVDTGTIIHQRSFPRLFGDNLASFSERGLAEEYICYRQTLYALATEQVYVSFDPFHICVSHSELV